MSLGRHEQGSFVGTTAAMKKPARRAAISNIKSLFSYLITDELTCLGVGQCSITRHKPYLTTIRHCNTVSCDT